MQFTKLKAIGFLEVLKINLWSPIFVHLFICDHTVLEYYRGKNFKYIAHSGARYVWIKFVELHLMQLHSK